MAEKTSSYRWCNTGLRIKLIHRIYLFHDSVFNFSLYLCGELQHGRELRKSSYHRKTADLQDVP